MDVTNYLSEIAPHIHKNAIDKGFWSGESVFTEEYSKTVCGVMIMTELGEFVNEYRKLSNSKCGEELADVIIRIMDLLAYIDAKERYRYIHKSEQISKYEDYLEMGYSKDEAVLIHIAHDLSMLSKAIDPVEKAVGNFIVLAYDCYDLGEKLGYDMKNMIENKMVKNSERPVMHGHRF